MELLLLKIQEIFVIVQMADGHIYLQLTVIGIVATVLLLMI